MHPSNSITAARLGGQKMAKRKAAKKKEEEQEAE
jgi:hypothetical protein